jgi:hypothetical protein
LSLPSKSTPLSLTTAHRGATLPRRASTRDSRSAQHGLSLSWTDREISPNYGKAITGARFEGAGWIGEMWVWATGETELGAVRTSDGSDINKHYDLAYAAELEDVLSELIGLIRDGALPPDAVTYRAP